VHLPDREFLRQFMEQVELEREAALEPGDERELRLKEAFSKGGMVWVRLFVYVVVLFGVGCYPLYVFESVCSHHMYFSCVGIHNILGTER